MCDSDCALLAVGFHLLEDGYDHVEARPLRRVLVHADLDQARHVRRDAGGNRHAQVLQRHLQQQRAHAHTLQTAGVILNTRFNQDSEKQSRLKLFLE